MNAGRAMFVRGSAARSPALLVVCLLAWGSVALALFLQHGLGMQPCAWCTLQRLVYIVLGAVALLGWGWSGRTAVRRVAGLVAAITGVAGIAAALYQQFVASKTSSCVFTLADKIIGAVQLDELMPWMFKARAACDEANVDLLGFPFAWWSALLFLVLTVLSLAVLFAPSER
ncbi:MAG: disulfide bond formation protein B [Burkholderiaceae bacterium]|nr:disulfide bond formation protein B [Burkholderiaceae bacterium]